MRCVLGHLYKWVSYLRYIHHVRSLSCHGSSRKNLRYLLVCPFPLPQKKPDGFHQAENVFIVCQKRISVTWRQTMSTSQHKDHRKSGRACWWSSVFRSLGCKSLSCGKFYKVREYIHRWRRDQFVFRGWGVKIHLASSNSFKFLSFFLKIYVF